MDHKERVKQKHAIYSTTGYKCTDIVSDDDKSSFMSVKDDVYRLHEYTHNDAVVFLASKDAYDTASGVTAFPVVAVEEVAPVEEVVQEEVKPVAKKQSKKKGV